jgi:ankyrin repeat protein
MNIIKINCILICLISFASFTIKIKAQDFNPPFDQKELNSNYGKIFYSLPDKDKIKKFISEGFDINSKGSSGKTPLLSSSLNYENLKVLIELGADINSIDDNGENALFLIAHFDIPGVEQCIDLLIKSGINVNEKNKNGKTPLMEAGVFGNLTLVKELIKSGANLQENDNNENNTLLNVVFMQVQESYKKKKAEIISLLISNGCDINCLDKNGSTPLIIAVENENVEIVKVLLKLGAKKQINNNKGENVFTIVNKLKNIEILNMLNEN